MKAPITYIPGWVANRVADPTTIYDRLHDDLSWIKHTDAPRHEYYANDVGADYTYGRGAGVRTYKPQDWHLFMRVMQHKLQEEFGGPFEVVFLNRYDDQRMHLGWHADDSPEMDHNRPIPIISLGAEREIWFRDVTTYEVDGMKSSAFPPIEKLKLEHGSLCLMHAGMQRTWQHRIPKADHVVGGRISLTFRGYVNPEPEAAE